MPIQHHTFLGPQALGGNSGGEGLRGGSSGGGGGNSHSSGARAGRAAQPPASSTAIVPSVSGVNHYLQHTTARDRGQALVRPTVKASAPADVGAECVMAILEAVEADAAQPLDEGAGSAMRGQHSQMGF